MLISAVSVLRHLILHEFILFLSFSESGYYVTLTHCAYVLTTNFHTHSYYDFLKKMILQNLYTLSFPKKDNGIRGFFFYV